MRINVMIALVIVSGAILIAGFRLSQSNSEDTVAALVSTPVKASISVQAMNSALVTAQPMDNQIARFNHEVFDYHLSYPANWDKQRPSANVMIFQSPQATTQVRVEAVGPLADGLTAFVNRSLRQDTVISRQSLTVQGLPAERVVADRVDGQATTFYVDAGKNAYVITGMGEQKAIEQIARSFNAP